MCYDYHRPWQAWTGPVWEFRMFGLSVRHLPTALKGGGGNLALLLIQRSRRHKLHRQTLEGREGGGGVAQAPPSQAI